MNTKTSHLCRRVVKAFSALGIAKICVLTYVLFVMGSLFFAPWEGWGYAYSRPDMWGHQTWEIQRVTRYGPIFSPPANFYGANPKATDDYQQSQQAKNKPPRLHKKQFYLNQQFYAKL